MNIHDIVNASFADTKDSLQFFLPELTLCAAIVLMLLVRVFNWGRRIDAFYFALAGSIVALYFTAPWIHLHDVTAAGAITRTEIFTGMLVVDTFTVFVRSILFVFAVLFVVFMKLSGMPDRENSADVYTLVLGATLGMCLMASANHLLMVFLAVEMASVPSYALAGMLRGQKLASEAALKYSIYGAGTAGVMLYGISLVAGLLNTAHLPTLAARLAEKLNTGMPAEEMLVLAFAGLMIMVGLAFKLSAVPFHFWCPDVFEGATAEVNAFLSVASKAAALALLVRVAIGFGALPPAEDSHTVVAAAPAPSEAERIVMVGYVAAADEAVEPAHAMSTSQRMAKLQPARDFIGKLIAFFAVITCTFGNFAAYGQTNIKRLMAYSTIAHAGYMMMAVPAVMTMAGTHPELAQEAVAALCIYLAVYLFMNLAAFAIIAFLRNAMHSEEIADYAGLIRRHSVITICMVVTLFSLIGMPPLAGFVGKLKVFAALVDGYVAVGNSAFYLLVVLVIGGLNTVVSLFYYLRVIKVMTIDPEPQDRPPFKFSDVSLQGAYVCLVTAPTVILFFFWDDLNKWALTAAKHLLL